MLACLPLFWLTLLQSLFPAGVSGNGIIGGKKAKAHSRPYMASLQQDRDHFCGAFLVREDFIMTAAHCFKDNNVIVVLGTNNIKKKEKSRQTISVEWCERHPDYLKFLKNQYNFDIMLCKLERNAVLNKNVKIIDLPNEGENLPESTECLMSGWGQTKPGSSAVNALLDVILSIQNSTECSKRWHNYLNPDKILCTYFDGKKGICQGDSGGPLVCKNKAYGIASATARPCNEHYPNIYMKISAFIPWIEQTMKRKDNVWSFRVQT